VNGIFYLQYVNTLLWIESCYDDAFPQTSPGNVSYMHSSKCFPFPSVGVPASKEICFGGGHLLNRRRRRR